MSLYTQKDNESVTERLNRQSRHIWEMCIFSMLGALMFVSKLVMEFLPNIHLLGVLTITYTIVYRAKALIPIYIYVLINGVYAGFSFWWMPYTYIWTILWAVIMILPKKMSGKTNYIVYPLICALHGLLFGILYAPAQAIMFGLTFQETVAWVIAGIPFDLIHSVGNLAVGLLIVPLSNVLRKLSRKYYK